LFERAIVARDEGAWAALYARYHCLLTTWVRRCGAFAHINESCEDLADQAFARVDGVISGAIPAASRRFPHYWGTWAVAPRRSCWITGGRSSCANTRRSVSA